MPTSLHAPPRERAGAPRIRCTGPSPRRASPAAGGSQSPGGHTVGLEREGRREGRGVQRGRTGEWRALGFGPVAALEREVRLTPRPRAVVVALIATCRIGSAGLLRPLDPRERRSAGRDGSRSRSHGAVARVARAGTRTEARVLSQTQRPLGKVRCRTAPAGPARDSSETPVRVHLPTPVNSPSTSVWEHS